MMLNPYNGIERSGLMSTLSGILLSLMNPYNGIERGVLSHILLSSLRYKNPYNGIERRLTTTTFY
jgi:hypothetical protein